MKVSTVIVVEYKLHFELCQDILQFVEHYILQYFNQSCVIL